MFFVGAIGAIAGACGVVVLRDPFLAVLSLVVHLLFLAVLFLLLRAEFIAAAQVVVYAGAVMVLYVFVVAYVGDQQVLKTGGSLAPGLRLGAIVFATALLVELLIALLGGALAGLHGYGAAYHVGFGTPRAIGNLLLTKFLLPFEVASLLLLIAAVGAVVLARRRRGLEEEEELQVVERPRPRGTGTLHEGVESLAFAAAHERGEES